MVGGYDANEKLCVLDRPCGGHEKVEVAPAPYGSAVSDLCERRHPDAVDPGTNSIGAMLGVFNSPRWPG